MKKVLSFIVLVVLTMAFLCGCTTNYESNSKVENKNLVEVDYFDGSTHSTLSKEKGSFLDLNLSELAYNHTMQFKGWNIGGVEYEAYPEVFPHKIDKKVEIEPIFNIGYSQKMPESLDYFSSRLNFSKYNEFAALSSPSFIYPGLSEEDNTVIQGVTYIEKYNLVLISAYIDEQNAWFVNNSVIFVMDMNQVDSNGFKGKLTKTIILHDTDGSNFTGHVGGIAATEKNIFVTAKYSLLRLPLDIVLLPHKLIFAKFEEKISMPVSSSYCFFEDNVLWVGEFYEKEDYPTDDSHKSTHNDVSYTAWTVGYELDENDEINHDKNNGFKKSALKNVAVPDYVLMHGDKIQGFATINSKVVLSESYGRKNDSHWFIYDKPNFENITGNSDFITIKIEGIDVPAYYLTNPKTLLAPPMSEDLTVYKENNKEYLLFTSEAACKKYMNILYGSVNPSSICWKIDLSLLS